MRRFITYLFAYHNGAKTQNIGFVKTDIRNDVCRMSVHVRGAGDSPQKIQICILTRRTPDGPLVGIPVAEAAGAQQNMVAEFSFSAADIMDSGISLEDAKGVAVAFSNGGYAASCWSDEAGEDFCRGRYTVYTGKPEDVPDKPELAETPEAMPGKTKDVATPEPLAEFSTQKSAEDCRKCGTGRTGNETAPMDNETGRTGNQAAPAVTYEKIDITGIRRLPKRCWYLSNNSFLIHGYFHYQHLILKTVEEHGGKKQYLGVPGIYEAPEKMMAMLFGFPEFEAEATREPESEEQVFGYWLCPLQM